MDQGYLVRKALTHSGTALDAPPRTTYVGIWRQVRPLDGNTRVARKIIPASQLYAILDREFRELRPAECRKCRVPLPFFRRPPDEVSANWAIGTPSDCSFGCHMVIAELLTKLWTRYDIEQETVN